MRTILLVFLCAVGLFAQGGSVRGQAGVPAPPPTATVALKPEDAASIEGKVTNAATGEGVRKASITLQPASGPPLQGSFTTTADAGGKFAMANLEPRAYRLTVNATGFASISYGAKAPGRPSQIITLAAGQKQTGIDVEMIAHGVITGRVVDEDGEPMPRVNVSVMRPRYVNGVRQLGMVTGGLTDDRGMYRISRLAPGRYYVSAGISSASQTSGAVERSGSSEAYIPTYYPGTVSAKDASSVEAPPGIEIQGINLTMKKTQTATVRGRAVLPADTSMHIMVRLQPVAGSPVGGPIVANGEGKELAFEFKKVAPGSYVLGVVSGEAGKPFVSQTPMEVGTKDIENLVVPVGPGWDLNGEVREDDGGTLKLNGLRLVLPTTPFMPFANAVQTTLGDDGRFTLTNVSPVQYAFSLAGLPPNYYVKSIRAGQTEVLETGLDLRQGSPGALRIIVSGKAGQITGIASDRNGKPVPAATVVMVPTKDALQKNQQFYRTATTNGSGQFTMQGITPGDYRVFAWEEVENGAWMDPDFMLPLMSRGKPVSIRESGSESVSLVVIPVGL